MVIHGLEPDDLRARLTEMMRLFGEHPDRWQAYPTSTTVADATINAGQARGGMSAGGAPTAAGREVARVSG